MYRAKIQAINGQDQTGSIHAVDYIPSDALPPDDLDEVGDHTASVPPNAGALGLVSPSGPESHLKPLPDWRGVLSEGDGDLCEAVRLGVAAVERLNEAKGTKLIRPGHCSSTGAAAAVASSFPGASTAVTTTRTDPRPQL